MDIGHQTSHPDVPPLPSSFEESAQIEQLAAALVQFQGAVKNPPRSREVEVSTKGGGRYSFSYAPLETVTDAIREHMAAAGLGYLQVVRSRRDGGRGMELVTRLIHASGQWVAHGLPLNPGSSPQQLGSELTYMRRYGLITLLGLASDDDDDGNAASGNEIQGRRDYGRDDDRRYDQRDDRRDDRGRDDREATRDTRSSPPSTSDDEAALRKQIGDFHAGLKAQESPGDADAHWIANKDLLTDIRIPQVTVDFLKQEFRNVWKQDPPAFPSTTSEEN